MCVYDIMELTSLFGLALQLAALYAAYRLGVDSTSKKTDAYKKYEYIVIAVSVGIALLSAGGGVGLVGGFGGGYGGRGGYY